MKTVPFCNFSKAPKNEFSSGKMQNNIHGAGTLLVNFAIERK
jgi:hypothetical protein